jgi:hypothetical protein
MLERLLVLAVCYRLPNPIVVARTTEMRKRARIQEELMDTTCPLVKVRKIKVPKIKAPKIVVPKIKAPKKVCMINISFLFL